MTQRVRQVDIFEFFLDFVIPGLTMQTAFIIINLFLFWRRYVDVEPILFTPRYARPRDFWFIVIALSVTAFFLIFTRFVRKYVALKSGNENEQITWSEKVRAEAGTVKIAYHLLLLLLNLFLFIYSPVQIPGS